MTYFNAALGATDYSVSGSRAAMEKAQKAILFLENFIVTIIDSSTPDTHLIEKKKTTNKPLISVKQVISKSINR